MARNDLVYTTTLKLRWQPKHYIKHFGTFRQIWDYMERIGNTSGMHRHIENVLGTTTRANHAYFELHDFFDQ